MSVPAGGITFLFAINVFNACQKFCPDIQGSLLLEEIKNGTCFSLPLSNCHHLQCLRHLQWSVCADENLTAAPRYATH